MSESAASSEEPEGASESERRWRSIAENPFDYVVVIDRAYRYTYVNHTAPGIAIESLIGKATPFDFTAVEHHAVMREAYETTFATGRATSYDTHSPELDAWYSSVVGPIYERGSVTSLSILTRDITAQKRAEAALNISERRLREAQRLETIGTLAGGIAHDINNLLTPILSHADLAQLSMAEGHPAQKHVVAIREASLRARDLVRRVLLFSRGQHVQKAVLDLGESVREHVRLHGASMPGTVELVLALPPDAVWVSADRTQIDQVISNLATNALQAMGEMGGRLEVSLRRAAVPAGSSELDPGDYAVLTVRDDGPGMDRESQRRAFEPFFTTKTPGGGTGLGLSIVHGIIRGHGGAVSVVSAPGRGATFVVHLPLAAAPPQPAANPATE